MSISTTKWTRREILSTALGWAGGAAVIAPEFARAVTSPSGHYAPKLSVEGYIWTQYFGRQKETVAAGEEEALKDTHQAGYQRIELSDPFFKPAVRNQTRDLLAKYQLLPESVYAGTTLHEAAAAEASIHDVLELVDFLKPLGTRVIVTNPSPKPKGERKTDAELERQVTNINRLGAALRQRGIRLLLHHHTPELVDNGREWWYELGHTDAKLAGCCVDVHWAYRGGQDVMPFLRRVGTRVEDIHLRNSQHGVWMEDFGPGDVDYSPVAAYLRSINYDGLLVVELAYEKDTVITRSLQEDLRRSRIYTEKTFGL